MTTPIPSPPAVPFIGNVTNLDRDVPLKSMTLLAKEYGPIFKLVIFDREIVFISSHELIDEVSDENRFHKHVVGPLKQIRGVTADALFTARTDEPNWAIAHHILAPAFGAVAIRDMFPDMLDICSQLVLKWERFGPDFVIDPVDDFTRLTFDTAALCTMSYRFNSFYREGVHPFLTAMARYLKESFARANTPAPIQAFKIEASRDFESDAKLMMDVCDQVFAERKLRPSDRNDVLNRMLTGRAADSDSGLSDANIKAQLVTFLIAGHETTSGLLSFVVYYLLGNPSAYQKAREEVDRILGAEPIKQDHMGQFVYLSAALREALRLSPSAPQYTVTPFEDTTIGNGKYAIKKDVTTVLLLPLLHRDPKVWGDDAEEFRPERMLDKNIQKLPKNAWKPFGNGVRGCIGRPFALAEALITLATLIQKFDLRLHDPSYKLTLKQTLTIKPLGFQIRAAPRKGAPDYITPCISSPTPTAISPSPPTTDLTAPLTAGKPLYVCFGSNAGTCESFAQILASGAAAKGFRARASPLDEVADKIPTDGPLVIITASYAGQPPDNARHFVARVSSLKSSTLGGVQYALFGCGDPGWADTYQAIPKLCDVRLAEAGANRLLERGEGNASLTTLNETFRSWTETLWKKLGEVYNVRPDATVVAEDGLLAKMAGVPRAIALQQSAAKGQVVLNRLLTKPGVPTKRHIEFQLPQEVTYRSGDYLAIVPTNPPDSVRRVLSRFAMTANDHVTITSHGPTLLPMDASVSVSEVLSGYVELAQPAARKDIEDLLALTPTGPLHTGVQGLLDAYEYQVLQKRLSVIDILEQFPDINLPLNSYLKMLPSMRVRQYSISSSPLRDPERLSITLSVVDTSAVSGRGHFVGVSSSYLSSLEPGDWVHLSIRPSPTPFHLPADPTVPIVMFCAGSGYAPMRGFIQERAAQAATGLQVGKALLFVGCRAEDQDYLYGDELAEWTKVGVVDVRPAFSQQPERSLGCKYVQDRIWHDREDVIAQFRAGARFYTCGSTAAAAGIRGACVQMIKEARQVDNDEAARLMAEQSNERYAIDVFG